MKREPGYFTRQEFAIEYGMVFADKLKTNISPAKMPQAVLLGGQSGAGKTTLHRVNIELMNHNATVINGDEYRSLHPRFLELDEKYGKDSVVHTAAWAGNMVEALVDGLSRMKYNLIIEGTLRTAEAPTKTATLLRERGYGVSLALMAVKPDISLISCQIRYHEMRIAGTVPRAVDPKHHMTIVENIVSNLEMLENSGLFDSIALYDRAKTQLFPRNPETRKASEALHEILYGPWSSEEKLHYEWLKHRLNDLEAQ